MSLNEDLILKNLKLLNLDEHHSHIVAFLKVNVGTDLTTALC